MGLKDNLPYINEQVPGIGGKIKTCWRDFIVEEIPLYEFSGSGSHLYIQVEKRGRTTMDAVVEIARALKISRQQIGYAGLKDTWAVTTQWMSIEHMEAEHLENLNIPRLRILQTARHENKLRIGHLAGNRFTVRIRNVTPAWDQALRQARDILKHLTQTGVCNYFGPQRFGRRGDTHHLGQAIIQGDMERFLSVFLGEPLPMDQPLVVEARTLYDQGDYEGAYAAWPGHFHDQRRTLRALLRGKNKRQAHATIDKHLKRLYVSAFQSILFNQLLAARMPHINVLFRGDVAYKHDNGACFLVEDVQREQDRCKAFEISPTGPIFGYQMLQSTDQAGEMENAVLEQAQLQLDDFRLSETHKVKGGRRPLRFLPRETSVSSASDELGPFIQLHFVLDPGCYATSVLREITKNQMR